MKMEVPSAEDLQKLRAFIEFAKANPTLLHLPQLTFVKDFIEHFGGTVPAGEKRKSEGQCPYSATAGNNVNTEPISSDSEMESELSSDISDLEISMDGVIEPDEASEQPMGDPEKCPTEEEMDEASNLRSQAAVCYGEQNFGEAVALLTKAIMLHPNYALLHAKRGQAFLKQERPVACIADCNRALELNCDSAAAYKYRGRAHRLLGHWELAAQDLRQACKLDFDEEADEWLREVQPNAQKIEQHHIRIERQQTERFRKKEEKIRKREAAKHQEREESATKPGGSGNAGGPEAGASDWGFPRTGGDGGANVNFAEMLSSFQDPEIAAALLDISRNPANIEKYKSNPKVVRLMQSMEAMNLGKEGGRFPGFPNFASFGNFAANAANAAKGANATAEQGASNPTSPNPSSPFPPSPNMGAAQKSSAESPKPEKPDFVDDGLD